MLLTLIDYLDDFHRILNENQLNGSIPDTLGLVRTLEVV